MRSEETRIAVDVQRAREYEAFSRYAQAEKIAELHDTIDRPLGTFALRHTALDDATLIAQSFVMPGFGIHPETPHFEQTETTVPAEPRSREFGMTALAAMRYLPDETQVSRLQALQYAASGGEHNDQSTYASAA